MPNFKRVPKKTLKVIADLIDQIYLTDTVRWASAVRAVKAYPQVWAYLSAATIQALTECGIKPATSDISDPNTT